MPLNDASIPLGCVVFLNSADAISRLWKEQGVNGFVC